MSTSDREPQPRPQRRLRGPLLCGLLLLALAMGPGPGALLVNPSPTDAPADALLLGIPKLYLWALLWLAVEIGIVLVAYHTLWKREPD